MTRRIIFRTKNTIFTAVKMSIYLPELMLSFAMSLNEIRLAIDAISVPNPPRFTPTSRAVAFCVKPEINLSLIL